MTTEEKADVMYALELGLDALNEALEDHVEKNGHVDETRQMQKDIELVEKAQEIMRLA